MVPKTFVKCGICIWNFIIYYINYCFWYRFSDVLMRDTHEHVIKYNVYIGSNANVTKIKTNVWENITLKYFWKTFPVSCIGNKMRLSIKLKIHLFTKIPNGCSLTAYVFHYPMSRQPHRTTKIHLELKFPTIIFEKTLTQLLCVLEEETYSINNISIPALFFPLQKKICDVL